MANHHLLARCAAKNPSIVYTQHVGDRGQIVLDIRATVDGVRVGLSAHVPPDALERHQDIERQVLESAADGVELGIDHWTKVVAKKVFR